MDQYINKDSNDVYRLELIVWAKALLITVFVFCGFFAYVYIASLTLNLSVVSGAIAATAAILIGSSFALSSLCFYFDFLDKWIFYRKYIGLIGFGLALLYSIMLLFVDSQRYFYGFLENIDSLDVILGLSAMSIFTVMALISNKWAMVKLEPHRWREILRLGYVAYALLVIRAAVLEKDIWAQWWQSPNYLPPVRLVISVFALLVILLRVSLIPSKYFKNKKEVIEGVPRIEVKSSDIVN